MTLLEDINKGFEEDSWFDPFDLDDVTIVQDKQFVDQTRWYTYFEAVYERNGEYVGVTYCEGSTEYQDDGMDDPEVYSVVPVPVTTIKYERVK